MKPTYFLSSKIPCLKGFSRWIPLAPNLLKHKSNMWYGFDCLSDSKTTKKPYLCMNQSTKHFVTINIA